MFSALAVFSVFCLGMVASSPQRRIAASAPKSPRGGLASNRPDDITCKPVKYWDCQFGRALPVGLPTCEHEEVCSQVKGKSQCRMLPRADKCLHDSGKICTKKTGKKCVEAGLPNTNTTTTPTKTTTASPGSPKPPRRPLFTTASPAAPLDFDDKIKTPNATRPAKRPTFTTTTAASPAAPLDFDYEDKTPNATKTPEEGCTTGEEIVCEAKKQKTSSLPKCSEKGTVCKNVGGKPKCHEVTPKKCRSETGKLCTTEVWRVCGPGTGGESDLIIAEAGERK